MKTIRDLTRQLLTQDLRWAQIVDRLTAAKNPAARMALRFYQTTWQLALSRYFDTVAARNMSFEPISPTVNEHVLTLMRGAYAEARKAGLPASSFVLPEAAPEESLAVATTKVSGGRDYHDGGWIVPTALLGISVGLGWLWLGTRAPRATSRN